MRIGYDVYASPIGDIYIVVSEEGVLRAEFYEGSIEENLYNLQGIKQDKELCKEAVTQLKEYFNGERKEFKLSLVTKGTDFQKKVWEALKAIPYGETRSYKDIAESVGSPKAVRAVGQANRRNPLPIFIPCHRVIGTNGKLVGYAGTRTDLKDFLLMLENSEGGQYAK